MNQRMLVFSSIFEGRSLQLAPVGKMGGGKGCGSKGGERNSKGGKRERKGGGCDSKGKKIKESDSKGKII